MRQLVEFSLIVALALAAGLAWRVLGRQDAPVSLRFVAGAPTGEYYDFASALRDLAAVQVPDIRITVVESEGAAANAAALAAGDAELGLVQSDTVVVPGVQAIAAVFPEVLHLVARDGSGIATPADLAGKRVALMPAGSGSNAVFDPVMAHYGLASGDFDGRMMTAGEAKAALRAGEADVMARMIALGNDDMRDLLRTPGLRLVPLEQAEAIQMFAPALERLVIPRGALSGRPPVPPEDIEALGVQGVLVVDAEVPARVVRRLTELLYESRTQLLALDEQTALLGPPGSVAALGFAIHPGAQSYFDADKPLFLVEYSDSFGLGLSLAVILASAIWQLKRWAEGRRKNRGDAYNGALARAVEELRRPASPESLDAIEAELYAIFRRVVYDVDHDRLAENTLPTFDFVWRSATDLLARRRSEVAGAGAGCDAPPPDFEAEIDRRSASDHS